MVVASPTVCFEERLLESRLQIDCCMFCHGLSVCEEGFYVHGCPGHCIFTSDYMT